MSHSTTFNLVFNDKRSLFRAMRNLGLSPENRVWSEYSTYIGKVSGIGGNIIGRLLTGAKDNINIFFSETNEGLKPNFESHELTPEDLQVRSSKLLRDLKSEYLKVVVESMVDTIKDAGIEVSMSEETTDDHCSYMITLGNIDKALIVTMNEHGVIEEKVQGVLGTSCVDLTESIEQKLTVSPILDRVWTHEYDVTIEDKQIQVLKLNNN